MPHTHYHGHENHGHMHGFSLPEQVQRLNHRVEGMECFIQDINNRADGVISKIEKSAYYNGAYYVKQIKKQELYDEGSGCAYTLFTVPECDVDGKSIDVDLKLAYGDATNSGVREDIFKAGLHHMSDKIFTAGIGTNFTGVGTYKGAPLAGTDDVYTIGFTGKGHFKWYPPNVDRHILQADHIKDSFGVEGILVNNNELTPDKYGVNVDEKCTRVGFGVNHGGRVRYIMVVSDFDARNQLAGQNTGMTAAQMADIMSNFCNVAVCVSASKVGDASQAACLDKGQIVTRFPDAEIPDNVAFWSISKKQRYNNEFTRDMGYLWQLYGELDYYYRLELDGIQVLIQRLLAVETRLTALEGRVDNIEDEIVSINAEIDQIQSDLADLRNDFEAYVVEVNGRLDDHDSDIAAIQAMIAEIQETISEMDTVIQGVQQAISAVQTDIETLKNQFTTLQQNFDDLRSYIGGLPKGDYVYKFDTHTNGVDWLEANLVAGTDPNRVIVIAMEGSAFRVAAYTRSGTQWTMATEDNNPIDYNFGGGKLNVAGEVLFGADNLTTSIPFGDGAVNFAVTMMTESDHNGLNVTLDGFIDNGSFMTVSNFFTVSSGAASLVYLLDTSNNTQVLSTTLSTVSVQGEMFLDDVNGDNILFRFTMLWNNTNDAVRLVYSAEEF